MSNFRHVFKKLVPPSNLPVAGQRWLNSPRLQRLSLSPVEKLLLTLGKYDDSLSDVETPPKFQNFPSYLPIPILCEYLFTNKEIYCQLFPKFSHRSERKPIDVYVYFWTRVDRNF